MAFFDEKQEFPDDDELIFSLDDPDDADDILSEVEDIDILLEDEAKEIPASCASTLLGVIMPPPSPRYDVDVALVLDLTGAMKVLIEEIRRNLPNFRALLEEWLKQRAVRYRRQLGRLRVRIVGFRDYNYAGMDPEDPLSIPMLQTPFYDLDDERERAELQSFVDQLRTGGGGDMPESSLEALHYAINSDWATSEPGSRRRNRHVIMLFTDAAAHRLGDERNAGNPDYPMDPDMPCSLSELYMEYSERMSELSKRLLLFAPKDRYPWTELSMWDNTALIPVEADFNLHEVSIEDIMHVIGCTI